ncbi:hypothetical protein A3C68_02600 [Candidatus Kuenenbacteria bacterium RIFCSPHIGHO2_02_FULL_42_29]|nr:MAG: hypothetical protein A3C68_02600 [Candidatus Kuenenbacteria bacterium RIFCSPHIGHO2_02_FULL_42_29]
MYFPPLFEGRCPATAGQRGGIYPFNFKSITQLRIAHHPGPIVIGPPLLGEEGKIHQITYFITYVKNSNQ